MKEPQRQMQAFLNIILLGLIHNININIILVGLIEQEIISSIFKQLLHYKY